MGWPLWIKLIYKKLLSTKVTWIPYICVKAYITASTTETGAIHLTENGCLPRQALLCGINIADIDEICGTTSFWPLVYDTRWVQSLHLAFRCAVAGD